MSTRTRPSRRAVLLGGAGALSLGVLGMRAIQADVLPGKVQYEHFASQHRHREVTWGLFLPRGLEEASLPVALLLHGKGGTARSAQDLLHVEAFLADHVRRGHPPLAVVSVDGGDAYWHPRRDGDDPLTMITDELLPRVERKGLAAQRIGVLGYSMGGYAALMLARESEAGRLGGLQVAAAAASSPALFASARASAPGAFDGAADWARWGDLAAHPGVRRTPLTVSCGTSDSFAGQTRRYRSRCPRAPAGRLGPGRHDAGYWRSLLPDQLAFLARHLTARP
jgi:S-formylglutathione hydrolase FrmB